ncbi:MtaA/CmuA family methyltransferase [Candidatus Formimonas warabiya]|uniref:Methyltransferase n=1 Tax=Formimonas warabiya TaxID=1761012 RepID=A0A3G1KQL2_FORW1|nr:MtaA/CmuA family methyltransferase [Candidatus Formimonas warabiya]ATW24753.1 methyltransferase [Candidatus Formimonas warabiya]
MMKSKMTPKERVFAALNGLELDRPAVINPTSNATFESMQRSGSYFPQAHFDSDRTAALAAAGYSILGFDTVTPYFSVHLEAAALGCKMDWGNVDDLPTVLEYPLKDPEDFRIPANFLERKPVKSLLKSIKMLKKTHGEKVAVIGKVIGPWTLAYHLYGVANLLTDVILDPKRVKALLNSLKEVSLLFAQAQLEEGADILTWADHVTSDLVSPKVYEEFLLPIHQEGAALLGGVPIILHVCGNVLDRLELFAQTGFKAFQMDSRNSIPEAFRLVKDKMQITGNINNPSTLLYGQAKDVKMEVAGIIQEGIRLIAPECALPTRVPNRNLVEIVKTAQAFRSKV